MDLETVSLEELITGYKKTAAGYSCLLCSAHFNEGEIYPVDKRWLIAEYAVRNHVQQDHGERLSEYMDQGGKYVALTEHQRSLLQRLRQGQSDREIAQALSLAPATVRHQRFTFREKAKQAKLYLALYELAMEGLKQEEAPSPSKGGTPMFDGPFEMTQEEYEKTLSNLFETHQPLRLKQLSHKAKKRYACLYRIAQELEPDKRYTEKELNELLGSIYEDHVTIRRELVDYFFLDRTRDGSAYWVKEGGARGDAGALPQTPPGK